MHPVSLPLLFFAVLSLLFPPAALHSWPGTRAVKQAVKAQKATAKLHAPCCRTCSCDPGLPPLAPPEPGEHTRQHCRHQREYQRTGTAYTHMQAAARAASERNSAPSRLPAAPAAPATPPAMAAALDEPPPPLPLLLPPPLLPSAGETSAGNGEGLRLGPGLASFGAAGAGAVLAGTSGAAGLGGGDGRGKRGAGEPRDAQLGRLVSGMQAPLELLKVQ